MASRFWVGGTGTWDASDTTHWAATSNGAGGQSVPGSGDTVTFDGSSGGGTVTVNTTVNVTSITMGAFTGTLDFNANNNNVTLVSWSNNGSGTRTLKSGSGTWNLTGNALNPLFDQATVTNCTFSNPSRQTINLTYSGATGTRVINHGGSAGASEANSPNINVTAGTDILNVSTGARFNNLNFTGFSGSWTVNVHTIYGNLTISSGMTVSAGSSAINFSATSGTQVITSNGVTVNNPLSLGAAGGTVQFADNLVGPTTGARTVTFVAGTIDLNGKTITCTGGSINLASACTFSGQVVRTGSAVVAQAASGAAGMLFRNSIGSAIG